MNASHENIMLDLWIFKLHILKLHRKTILQQTPSSDTPTSGTPISFFFLLLLPLLGMMEKKVQRRRNIAEQGGPKHKESGRLFITQSVSGISIATIVISNPIIRMMVWCSRPHSSGGGVPVRKDFKELCLIRSLHS